MNHFIQKQYMVSLRKAIFRSSNNFSTAISLFKEENVDIRDISRMPKKYHDRMSHINQPDESVIHPDYYNGMHQSIDLKRKLFAKYGSSSDLNPGILWPSEAELDELIEFEKEWEPTLQQRWQTLASNREEEINLIKSKEKNISEQMSKMKDYINNYAQRLQRQRDQEQSQTRKREALIDEAREYYGYRIDPNDPRFEQMKLAKEEGEKLLKKKKKKEELLLRK